MDATDVQSLPPPTAMWGEVICGY